jgi:hypothetical protein
VTVRALARSFEQFAFYFVDDVEVRVVLSFEQRR